MSRIQRVLEKAQRDGTARSGRPSPPPSPFPDAPHLAGAEREAEPAVVAAAAGDLYRAAGLPADPDVHVVAAVAPLSPAAERYRALRTRISLAETGGTAYRTILVTSPGRAEGKTLTATNLALTMAQQSKGRVVLVDADLRKADVHEFLGVPESRGLSEVLAGEAALAEVIVEIAGLDLFFVPGGRRPPRPAELLGSAAMRAVLGEMRTRFDRVVIDTPPIGAVADAGILTPLVDGVLIVVRAGRTTTQALDRVIQEMDERRLIGLVLNDIAETDGAYGKGYPYPQAGEAERRRENIRPARKP